jgi:hypothetical protein
MLTAAPTASHVAAAFLLFPLPSGKLYIYGDPRYPVEIKRTDIKAGKCIVHTVSEVNVPPSLIPTAEGYWAEYYQKNKSTEALDKARALIIPKADRPGVKEAVGNDTTAVNGAAADGAGGTGGDAAAAGATTTEAGGGAPPGAAGASPSPSPGSTSGSAVASGKGLLAVATAACAALLLVVL